MNDHLKMLDMRLQERLSFSYGNVLFTEHEEVNPELFSEAKVLYIARMMNRDGTMTVGKSE